MSYWIELNFQPPSTATPTDISCMRFRLKEKHVLPKLASSILTECEPFLPGARLAHPHREHDPALRQSQGGLVDQHGPLQPRANSPRGHGGQNGVQEEPGPPDTAVPEGGAGEAAQLSEGG